MKNICLLMMFWLLTAGALHAQTTAFSYQGRLTDAAVAASGSFDFEFAVFDANSAGTQQGATLTLTGINVAAGIFTAQLDFGSAPFAAGAERFLEVRVKKPADANFTILTPRQRITGVPFGTRALSAATADTAATATNAAQLGGVAATNYLQTGGDGSQLTNLNAANITNGVVTIANGGTGSATQNFVDLTAAQTVAGDKTFSSAVNTTAQYNIGGNRVLSNPGQDNLFVGVNTGNTNTGVFNSFFGSNAGRSNTTGNSNSFFGFAAGFNNTAGSNSFFGSSAGRTNTTGSNNSFFGNLTGFDNTTGFSNAFFGSSAGGNNTTGANNSFFGSGAGNSNSTGSGNNFVGFGAGRNNTTGSNNIFIGNSAGTVNTAMQVTNSIAIGNNVSVSASNTIAVGTNAQTALIPGKVVLGASANSVSGGGGFLETFNVNGVSGILVSNVVLFNLNNISPSDIPVCMRLQNLGATGGNILARCLSSFSSFNNKTNVKPFVVGLDIVKRLKPVSFKWKTNGNSGIGLNAEDVAAIAPQIVTRNDQGAIQDVNENSLTVVLINAVKEQQKQIEAQKRQIDALVKLICAANPNAPVCQEEQK